MKPILYIQYRIGNGYTTKAVGGSHNDPIKIIHRKDQTHDIIYADGEIETVYETIKTTTKL